MKIWQKLTDWCRDSATIGWARFQMLLAAVFAALSAVDLSPVLGPKWLVGWMILSGVVTEIARRRTL